MKYNKQTILDYISGNETNCDIEKLENDSNFMLDVLELTKDKKILNLCDNRLLNDSEFIFNVLDIFKDDKLFCINLATDFVKKNKEIYDVDIINVALKAESINNDTYSDEFVFLSLYLQLAYIEFKMNIESQMKNEGLGSKLTYDIILINYPNEVLFKRFIARYMIRDIFDEIDTSLEYYVKSQYNTPEYIKAIGSRQYVLNIIAGYDKELADYTQFNLTLINNKIAIIDSIINDWEKEINCYEEDIYQITEAFWEFNNEISLDTYLKYIAKELNIPSLLDRTFESMNEVLIEEGYEALDICEINRDTADEITKNKLLNKLKKGVLMYIKNNKESVFNKEKINTKKRTKKIVKFETKQRDI